MGGEPLSLVTYDINYKPKTILPNKYSRILGLNVQNSTSWKASIEDGSEALLPNLRREKLGILKFIGKTLPFNSRNFLASGLLLSKIQYMLPIWGGGTEPKYLSKIQALINNSARFVTQMGPRTKTKTLMEALGWLDIRELVELHSLVSMWKVIWLCSPLYMHNKMQYNPDSGDISTTHPRLPKHSNQLQMENMYHLEHNAN